MRCWRVHLRGPRPERERDAVVDRWPGIPRGGVDRRAPRRRLQDKEIRLQATLKLTHTAIGVEVRRRPYDVVVDGERIGAVDMNDTFETPVAPGRHTLQVRRGRNSSRTRPFDAADGEVVAFRCTGKSILPIFLASFFVPNLALSLIRQ
jgi:hypothetical protein